MVKICSNTGALRLLDQNKARLIYFMNIQEILIKTCAYFIGSKVLNFRNNLPGQSREDFHISEGPQTHTQCRRKAISQIEGLIFYHTLQSKDIIKSDLMIQAELIELLCDFRRTETTHNFQFATAFQISDVLYNTLLQTLLSTAENLNLHNTTKFMAKKYLDIFLSANLGTDQNEYLLAVVTCLRVAAKFNQIANFANIFTASFCSEFCAGQYLPHKFLQCEAALMKILGFQFRVTTPYDFGIVKHLLPKEKKVMALLESVIDFAITLIDTRNSNAEEIFFGALLYCCKQKNASEICYSIVKATTFKWELSLQLADIIELRLSQMLSS